MSASFEVQELSELKALFKQALREMVQEERELLSEVFAEVLEDIALGRAIEQGLESEPVSREEVFRVLEEDAS